MTRWFTALTVTVALSLSATACTGPAETPPDAKVEVGGTKEAVNSDAKVEAVVKEVAPATDAPVLNVPPRGKAERDCANSDPKEFDAKTLAPMTLPADANAAMTDPKLATEKAPEKFKVKFETSKGDFIVEAYRPWSPNGVDRFYNMVKIGWFNEVKFFRAVDGFMTQFGVTPYPEANSAWLDARIPDDEVVQGNKRGVLTFAQCPRPNCRSNQLFINTKDNSFLDRQRFAGFAVVVEGMDVVDSMYTCYGDAGRPGRPSPNAKGPDQGLVQRLGNAYLDAGWPNLDGIKSATIVE
ncbi:MAG: peptidylprolyl isomerase [Myxococcota bacterium]